MNLIIELSRSNLRYRAIDCVVPDTAAVVTGELIREAGGQGQGLGHIFAKQTCSCSQKFLRVTSTLALPKASKLVFLRGVQRAEMRGSFLTYF